MALRGKVARYRTRPCVANSGLGQVQLLDWGAALSGCIYLLMHGGSCWQSNGSLFATAVSHSQRTTYVCRRWAPVRGWCCPAACSR